MMEGLKDVWKDVFVRQNSPYHIWNRYCPDVENKKLKIAFLHIPKTGGRQVDNIIMAAKEANGEKRKDFFVKYLNRRYSVDFKIDNNNIENEERFVNFLDGFTYVSQHFTGRQFGLVPDNFFKVSLIREPFARFRSHFLQYVYSNNIDAEDDVALNKASEYILESYSNIFLNTYSEYCGLTPDDPGIFSEIYNNFDFLCSVSYMDHMISCALGSNCKFYILSKNEHYSSANNKRFAKKFLRKWMSVFMEKNLKDLEFYKFVEKQDLSRQNNIIKQSWEKQIIVPPVKYFARPKSIYLKPKPFSINDNFRHPEMFRSIFDVYKVR